MSSQRAGTGGQSYHAPSSINPFAAHTVDTDYDPITVDDVVPAVPASGHPGAGGYMQGLGGGYSQGAGYNQGIGGAGVYNQPAGGGGAWGNAPVGLSAGSHGPPPSVPFAPSTTNTHVTGNIGKEPRAGYGPPGSGPPPTLFSQGLAGGPLTPPPGNGNNLFGEGASSSQGQPSGGPAAGGTPQPDPSTYALWNIRHYRTYFDVDTRDVLWRVANSLYGLFKADFMEVTMTSPDLYGPFWVSTTLIFVTAVAGNFASYISWFRKNNASPAPPPGWPAGALAPPPTPPAMVPALVNEQWFNDYTKLSVSVGLFYGYTFLLSFLLYLALRYFKSEMKLVNVWCIYGYAMTIFLPVSMACIVPIEWLRWLLVSLATVVSGLFLVMNFRATIYAIAPARAVLMLMLIAALHIGLGLALKLYFFQY